MPHLRNEIRTLAHLHLQRSLEADSVFREIPSQQGMVLSYIAHRKTDIYQRDLEKIFSVRGATASKTLQRMEENGLIVREAVKEDARLKRIVLTEKGKWIHEKMHAEMDIVDGIAVQGISESDLEIFYSVLDKMKENLRCQ